jgi:hypothetical protein
MVCAESSVYTTLSISAVAYWTATNVKQTHYFSENLVVSGIEPRTSGFVARNFDQYTAEAVRRK